MKQMIKNWKSMFLTVVLMLACLSMTVFATESPEGGEVSDGEKITTVNLKELFDAEKLVAEYESSFVYTGNKIEPEITLYMVNETGEKEEFNPELYTVEYKNNINAGNKAEIIVTAKEVTENAEDVEVSEENEETKEVKYEGSFSVYFKITPMSLNDAKMTLQYERMKYTGKALTPAVTVEVSGKQLKNNQDYTVTYLNNKELGTATVTVTGKGNYAGSKKLTFKIVVGVTKVSTTPAYNKVTVKWEKVVGATKYVLQRSTSKNSGFKTIATITSGSTVKYVDKDVKLGKTYYYRVKAYRNSTAGNYSAVVSQKVKPGKAEITKISRVSYNSMKVTWKKVSGASRYALYRSTSEKGKFEKIATIKDPSTLSYTDKKLTCGKTYYYKVRAYRKVSDKNYYGSYSDIKSYNTKPSKVSLKKDDITCSSTAITLKWKKASGATGYQIYRSTKKDSGYTKVKTVTKSSTLSWKDTGLKKDTVYYYKVRAYRKIDGKEITGSYSEVYKKSVAGWRYSTYDGQKVKYYYNAKGEKVKDVSKIIGEQKTYQIRVNKKKNTVTVYAKDGKNGYIIPVKAFVCSTGAATPLGTYKTPQKLRWQELDGPSYGQWCTRITGHILFHSVWYYKPKNTTLSVAQYNKLGTQASHGCVRLTAGDAKWIYDNCKLGTTVKIYNSSKSGPLGKPTAHKLKSWHTWDPTDPNMKSKCKSKGCH